MRENFSYRYIIVQIESKYKFPEKLCFLGKWQIEKNTEMKSCDFSLREIFLGELFHAISRLNFEGRRVFTLPLLPLIK